MFQPVDIQRCRLRNRVDCVGKWNGVDEGQPSRLERNINFGLYLSAQVSNLQGPALCLDALYDSAL